MDNIMNQEIKNKLKALTILYLEDEDSIRENISQTLDLIFNTTISVSNVDEAIIQYKLQKPDIILSDINMSGKNGIEFVQEIRETNKTIPVILLTAHTNTDYLIQANSLQLVNYLTKPVVFDELYNALIAACEEINGIIFTTKITQEMYENYSLTSSEQKLFDIFIHSNNKILSVEEIKNQLWDDPLKATDSAFKSLLGKLRKKIDKDMIQNVPGVGYYFDEKK